MFKIFYANPHAVTDLPDNYNAELDYDNNGNLIGMHVGSWYLFEGDYDYNNRLISDNSGAEYKYDHEGNRISKVVNEIATIYPNKYYVASGSNVEENIYANNQLVLTATNDGETMNLYYVHDDHLTSSSVMTKSDASVEQVVDYYPFGSLRFNQQSDPGNSYSQRQKFTQKELDSDASGLYYFGARYYSGDVGKFVSEDPVFWDFDQDWLLDPQNQNSYSYTRNNPVSYLDPDGRAPKSIGPGYYQANPKTKEVGFFLRHSIIASNIGTYRNGSNNISTVASNFAVNSQLSNDNPDGLGSQRNAFRHVLWQSIIAAKYGTSISNQVGNAHEKNPYVDIDIRSFSGAGQDSWLQADQTVDLLNNGIGVSIGINNPNASERELAFMTLDYYHNTGLYTAQQNGDNVEIKQTQISDQQYKEARANVLQTGNNGLKSSKNVSSW